jgi:ribosome maturation factor RimP
MLGNEELALLIRPDIEIDGSELVDVQVVPGKRRTLRIFVDRAGGVSIGDCAELSRRIARRLDRLEEQAGSYVLEVSSAGMNRPIWSLDHFRRFEGERVKIELTRPHGDQVHLTAVIGGVAGETIRLRVPAGDHEGEVLDLSVDDIASARLDLDPWKGRR